MFLKQWQHPKPHNSISQHSLPSWRVSFNFTCRLTSVLTQEGICKHLLVHSCLTFQHIYIYKSFAQSLSSLDFAKQRVVSNDDDHYLMQTSGHFFKDQDPMQSSVFNPCIIQFPFAVLALISAATLLCPLHSGERENHPRPLFLQTLLVMAKCNSFAAAFAGPY